MRICLLLISVFIFSNTDAQIKKGSTLLGGSLNLSSAKDQGTAFNISAQLGKAFKDNSVRGFQLRYSHSGQNNTNSNTYSGGIFYRKYIPVINGFYFFGEAGLNIGYFKFTSTSGFPASNTVMNGYYGEISLIPGLSYAVNSRLHLEIAFSNIATLYYSYLENKNTTGGITSSNRESGFGINTSTQHSFSNIQFGFRMVLGKK